MLPPLPTPILGEINAITITSPDLDQSLAFYQRLGFKEIFRESFPFPWIQVTDEALLIMFRLDKDPYFALTYYSTDAASVALSLEAKGIVFTYKPKPTDPLQRYVLKSPDELTISIITIPYGFRLPTGKTMLTMKPDEYGRPETYTNQTAGMYGELAHPVKDLEVSIAFWEKLGFIALSKMARPHPWAILSDGLSILGLHQTTQFSYPAITYFAADMKNKIEALKQNGLGNFVEQGPGNICITTPEQQHINLYSMG
jgi:catechol 2,3-dioxygenase-like lactoylglutathione lyase family enzyme